MRELVIGGVYRHFKGNRYRVLLTAADAGSSETLVIYQSLESPEKVWARPLPEFLSEVDREKYPGVQQKFRFTEEADYHGE